MENREAIKLLKTILRTVCLGNQKFIDAVKKAISALEKQEKKPAKAKFNKRYNKFVYFCPVCGEVTGHYDYCSDCGQAIDYDNPEPYTEEEA
jgi:hypothetical protein